AKSENTLRIRSVPKASRNRIESSTVVDAGNPDMCLPCSVSWYGIKGPSGKSIRSSGIFYCRAAFFTAERHFLLMSGTLRSARVFLHTWEDFIGRLPDDHTCRVPGDRRGVHGAHAKHSLPGGQGRIAPIGAAVGRACRRNGAPPRDARDGLAFAHDVSTLFE